MLKISHLKKNYKDFSLDCSMEVQPGMITGLIGKNGSGKSTTFKSVLGLIRPDSGRIELLGKKTGTDIAPEIKQKLGVVFADSGFSMYLTTTGVAWVIAIVLALICNFTAHKGRDITEIFGGGTSLICIALLMLAVIIPMSIYYGVEKGRQIAVVLWIILIAVIYALTKTAVISESMLDAWIGGTNLGKTFFITAFVTVMGYLSSWRISEQLMEKKEF